MRKLNLALALTASSILFSSITAIAADRDEVLANIEPIGKVRVAGMTIAAPAPAPVAPVVEAAPVEAAPVVAEAPAAAPAVDGQQIYNTACFACHGTGAAGAPKLGDAAAWAPRIALGMDTLMQSVYNGKNAMPPRAGNPTLSDEQLIAAANYMVNNSQ